MLDATRAPAAAADLFAAAPSSSGSSSLSAAAFSTPAPSTAGASAAPELMAHEAAHVVQQRAGAASASPYAGMF